jgi:predicted XRE-type DNA-binding protein
MANKPTHVTHESVLDDLGFSSGPAAVLKFKAELYQAILKVGKNYSQKELQRILGEPQPRLSQLLNGKIANQSVEKLLYYAGWLGIEARVKFAQTPKDTKIWLKKSSLWPTGTWLPVSRI